MKFRRRPGVERVTFSALKMFPKTPGRVGPKGKEETNVERDWRRLQDEDGVPGGVTRGLWGP